MSFPTRPLRSQQVLRQSMGADMALYDPVADVLHVLNATAATIWDLCDGEHTPDDMERVLRSRFRASAHHDVMRDVERALELFVTKDLIEVKGGNDRANRTDGSRHIN